MRKAKEKNKPLLSLAAAGLAALLLFGMATACWHKERRENLLLTSGAASLKRILRKVTAQRIRRKTKHQLPRHQRLYRHRMKARRFPTQRRKVRVKRTDGK